MLQQQNEAKQIPMSKELCELREAIEQANLLYTDLNSRISCVINNSGDSNIVKGKTPEEESSSLVKEIRILRRSVTDLCSRIRRDLHNIEI